MSVLIVIPARYASSRYPGKPLVGLRGPDGEKTLIRRSWEAATAVFGIARVVVATDDDRIADHAAGFGAEVVMTSSAARNGTERCAEVAALLPGYGLVVNLQGDAPLTPPWFVENRRSGIHATLLCEIATPVFVCDGSVLDGLSHDGSGCGGGGRRCGGGIVVHFLVGCFLVIARDGAGGGGGQADAAIVVGCRAANEFVGAAGVLVIDSAPAAGV